MRPSQLVQAVVSPRVSRPVLSTLSRLSSRRSEQHSAKRTISAYPVSKIRFHFLHIIVPSPNSVPLLSPFTDLDLPEILFLQIFGLSSSAHAYRRVSLSDEQPHFATSSCTMVCVDFTAVSGRLSSAIFRRGQSTSPCMTGSKPASANCHWASIRWSQSRSDSIPRRLPKVISRSCASIRGLFTFYQPWLPARPAPSVPIRSGSSKRASWCGFFSLPLSQPHPSPRRSSAVRLLGSPIKRYDI